MAEIEEKQSETNTKWAGTYWSTRKELRKVAPTGSILLHNIPPTGSEQFTWVKDYQALLSFLQSRSGQYWHELVIGWPRKIYFHIIVPRSRGSHEDGIASVGYVIGAVRKIINIPLGSESGSEDISVYETNCSINTNIVYSAHIVFNCVVEYKSMIHLFSMLFNDANGRFINGTTYQDAQSFLLITQCEKFFRQPKVLVMRPRQRILTLTALLTSCIGERETQAATWEVSQISTAGVSTVRCQSSDSNSISTACQKQIITDAESYQAENTVTSRMPSETVESHVGKVRSATPETALVTSEDNAPAKTSGPDVKFGVYVLALEDGCYYVGYSDGDYCRRIAEHLAGKGANGRVYIDFVKYWKSEEDQVKTLKLY